MSETRRWEIAVESGATLPSDRTLSQAAAELTGLLGSADPHIRNDLATGLLTSWIGRGDFDDLLVALGDGMCAGLRYGLGDERGESVFRRSSSALVLAAVVERDNVARLVHPTAVLTWADHALHWFDRERDLRGYVEGQGWAYAVAHGADVIAALGLSRHLGADELVILLDSVADRLAGTGTRHLVHAEDDRFAYAAYAVVQRGLVAPERLETWVRRATRPLSFELSGASGGANVNTLRFLRALHLMLRFGVRGMPWHRAAGIELDPDPPGRIELLRAVEGALRGYHPGLYRAPPDRPASSSG